VINIELFQLKTTFLKKDLTRPMQNSQKRTLRTQTIKAKNLFEAEPSYFLRLMRSQSLGWFASAGDFSLVTF